MDIFFFFLPIRPGCYITTMKLLAVTAKYAALRIALSELMEWLFTSDESSDNPDQPYRLIKVN